MSFRTRMNTKKRATRSRAAKAIVWPANMTTLTNFNRGTQERMQHIQVVQGKVLTEVGELHAGDIGAIAKLKDTLTGDTLGDKNAPVFYKPAQIPEPSITFAVEPKTRADEDKIGVAIHKILEEDT